jgi:hypothetical protein
MGWCWRQCAVPAKHTAGQHLISHHSPLVLCSLGSPTGLIHRPHVQDIRGARRQIHKVQRHSGVVGHGYSPDLQKHTQKQTQKCLDGRLSWRGRRPLWGMLCYTYRNRVVPWGEAIPAKIQCTRNTSNNAQLSARGPWETHAAQDPLATTTTATSDQRPATSDQRPATSDQRPAAVSLFLKTFILPEHGLPWGVVAQ